MSRISTILAWLKPNPEPFLINDTTVKRLGVETINSDVYSADVKHGRDPDSLSIIEPGTNEADTSPLISGASINELRSAGQTVHIIDTDRLPLEVDMTSSISCSPSLCISEKSAHDIINAGSQKKDPHARSASAPLTLCTNSFAATSQLLRPEMQVGKAEAFEQTSKGMVLRSSTPSQPNIFPIEAAAMQPLDTKGFSNLNRAVQSQSDGEASQLPGSSLTDPISKKRKAAGEWPSLSLRMSSPVFFPEYEAVEAGLNNKLRPKRSERSQRPSNISFEINDSLKLSSATPKLPSPPPTDTDTYDIAPLKGSVIPDKRPYTHEAQLSPNDTSKEHSLRSPDKQLLRELMMTLPNASNYANEAKQSRKTLSCHQS